MTGPVAARFDPCGGLHVSFRRPHPLEREVRSLRATVRALTIVAGCREDDRAKHRAEVADLERRIAELRDTSTATDTDERKGDGTG